MPPCSNSMWDRLPDDVIEIILRHRAAARIQLRWRWSRLFAHARSPVWPKVRSHLETVEAWRELFVYSLVRREWRHEPTSWLRTTRDYARAILHEAQHSRVWGSRLQIYEQKRKV